MEERGISEERRKEFKRMRKEQKKRWRKRKREEQEKKDNDLEYVHDTVQRIDTVANQVEDILEKGRLFLNSR